MKRASRSHQVAIEHLEQWVSRDPSRRRFEVTWLGPIIIRPCSWRGGWRVKVTSTRSKVGMRYASWHSQDLLNAALRSTIGYTSLLKRPR